MNRFLDLLLCCLGLLVIWPVLAAISLLILIFDGRPVFFRQLRVGRAGRPFRIWKFRTMVNDAEKFGKQLTVGRDPRITVVGRFLRATKLDELPQLFNVFVGEMSFVGPRPEVPRYVARYTPSQRRVLEVRPGITDPASIRFRRESELLAAAEDPERAYVEEIMPEKLRINLAYLQRRTCVSDLLVIGQTVGRLFVPATSPAIEAGPASLSRNARPS